MTRTQRALIFYYRELHGFYAALLIEVEASRAQLREQGFTWRALNLGWRRDLCCRRVQDAEEMLDLYWPCWRDGVWPECAEGICAPHEEQQGEQREQKVEEIIAA